MSLSSCAVAQQNIDWSVSARLPSENQEAINHIGLAGPISGIINDKLIIAGGANFPNGFPWDGGSKYYQKELYIYTIKSNSEIVFDKMQTFQDSLAYAGNFSDNKVIYSVGGERKGDPVVDAYIYEIVNSELSRRSIANLPIALTNGSLLKSGDILYFIGGENAKIVSDKIYYLDLSNGSAWKELLTLPYPISNTVAVIDDNGNILIAGGRKKNINTTSDIYDDLLQVNLKDKNVQKIASLPYPVAAGGGIYADGSFILIGGDDANTFHKVEKLIGQINQSEEGETKQRLIEQKNEIQRNHPGFRKDVWSFNLKTKKWTKLNSISGDSPVTTTFLKKDNMIIVPSGEVKAGVRTDQILTGILTK